MVMLPRSPRRLAMLLTAGALTLGAAAGSAAEAAQPSSMPRHKVHCVLADRRLFLGSAGAGARAGVSPARSASSS
jgi:hypothetical protein